MLRSAIITAAVLDKILTFLAPLFLSAATDMAAARQAAQATLDSHAPRNDEELRLVALNIAFGFGALDALGRAADPALPVSQVLRLRGNASTLHRASQQIGARLDGLRRLPPDSTNEPAITPTGLPPGTTDSDLLGFARTVKALPLTRQQRRAADRLAEKLRARQQENARLAERATQNAARKAGAAAHATA